MTRIVSNCVALVCLCLFWGQSLRAADASHSEQIKWGNESVLNEEHNTLGFFSGVLGGQIVLAGGTSDDYSRWGRNAVCLSENAGFAVSYVLEGVILPNATKMYFLSQCSRAN